MTNVFLPYNLQPDTFAGLLFQTPSGIALVGGSAHFTGDPDAAGTFDSLNLGTAQINTKGILLTSGDGTPPTSNTLSNYGVANSVDGDSDLDTIVHKALPGAGDTHDASILDFKVNADPGVKSIIFDVVFGSDEFPEWSNTSYVDIAAILVNGKNAAFFSGNAKKPLSVLDSNLGYFQDNQDGHITIEYDGLSNKLTVIAPVKTGVNDIKIAIADTGDSIYDSGIFVSNLRGSDKDLGGILNEIAGTDGNDKLKAEPGIDNVIIGGLGKDKLFANTGFDVLYGDQEDQSQPLKFSKAIGETALNTDLFKDTFVFKSVKFLEKSVKKTDVIADFDKKDVIDISKITGPKFHFLGKDHFHGDGDAEVYYKASKHKGFTTVYGDTDGDGKTDFTIKLLGALKLDAHDFHL